ncbi:MAG: hypothetical protein A2Y07_07455 [Planctomycetes bacterium GWF2_50_10]|nr:MAG: hypothetical protein A2Y07_07455 [Planctomycetes bacterium GWF2_50_10]
MAVDEELEAGEQERQVSVAESIRYRRRAQLAEKKAAELEGELEAQKNAKEDMSRKAGELEVENKLLGRLAKAGAIDMEAAMLLAKSRIGADGDIEKAVENLKKEKGYLFESSPAYAGRTAGVKPRVHGSAAAIEKAAKCAAKGGRGAAMMEYLRLRRNRSA